MKYLVTGGAGFIGSNIVDRLVSAGHGVVVIDNESSDAHDYFYYNDKAKYYKHDICDHDKIKHLFKGVDTVFHCAAEARIQPAIKNPLLAVKTNSYGTCSVLQAARDMGVRRVVYSSTSSAYGLIFLGAHFIWAFSLMFLFSGRGYWQELIESIVWAHNKLNFAPSIQPRALSITQGRAVGLAHYLLGGIGTTWSFFLARAISIS